MIEKKSRYAFPIWGYAGLILIGVFWPLNWGLEGLRSHWGFFFLWLGYFFTVDGLLYLGKGKSLVSDRKYAIIWLFLLSSPTWWIFEWMNYRVDYWSYVPPWPHGKASYIFFCSLNFSVVIPVVFVTSMWIGTFNWINHFKSGLKIGNRSGHLWVIFISGWLILFAGLIWPVTGLAFVWMSLFFILDPVNYWRGKPSLITHTATGDWRTIFALWLGCLICGLFWEMWNFYSSPKWIYHLPYFNSFHVFEMPLAGYLGYLPFSLELYALYHLVSVGRKGHNFSPIDFVD
jgi:hypothetical protein